MMAVCARATAPQRSVPDGQITCPAPTTKINAFVFEAKHRPNRAVSSHQGALAIVTDAGRDAMDANTPLTNGAERGRRSRVVLTPRRWRQVLRSDAQSDGDNKARSPERSRRKPLKPLRAGMPGLPGEPTVTTSCALYPFRTRDCGCIKRPAFPTPFLRKGGRNPAQLGRIRAARTWSCVCRSCCRGPETAGIRKPNVKEQADV